MSRPPTRSLTFHTVLYALGNIGSRMLGFIMLPIYTRKLSPADYGNYELLSVTASVIGLVLDAGLVSAVERYYHRYDDAPSKRRVASTATLFMAAVMAAALGVLWVLAPQVEQLLLDDYSGGTYFRLIAIAFTLNGISAVPLSYFRTEERSRLVVTISLCQLFVAFSLNILFIVVLEMRLLGVLVSAALVACLQLATVGFLCLRGTGFGFDGAMLRGMLRFGIPLIPGSLAYLVIHMGDRYFLKGEGGSVEVGIYALAYKFGMLVTFLLGQPFHSIWVTRRLRLFKDNELETIAGVYPRYVLFLLWLWLGIALLAEDGLRIVVGPEFRRAHVLIPILTFAYVLRSAADFHTGAIVHAYRTRLYTILRLASAGIALGLYVLLIPAYGSAGAAWATAGTMLGMFVLFYTFSQRTVRVPYPNRTIAKLTLVAVAVFGAGRLVPLDPGWTRIALLLALGLLYPFLTGEVRPAEVARLGRRILRRPA